MRSLMACVFANFYMQHFEEQAIRSAIKKPAHWFMYVDDSHGVAARKGISYKSFLSLNSIHLNIMFAIEVEQSKTIYLRCRCEQETRWFAWTLRIWKLYRHAKLEHYLAQKGAVLINSSPACQNVPGRCICDTLDSQPLQLPEDDDGGASQNNGFIDFQPSDMDGSLESFIDAYSACLQQNLRANVRS